MFQLEINSQFQILKLLTIIVPLLIRFQKIISKQERSLNLWIPFYLLEFNIHDLLLICIMLSAPLFMALRNEIYCCVLAVGYFGQEAERVSRKLQYWIELYVGLHYDCCMLAGLERQQWRDYCDYEQRLPWCRTEEAAPWISQQLGLLVFHIAVLFCVLHCVDVDSAYWW